MDFLEKALKALSSVAGSPMAFVGYIATLAAWVWAIKRNHRIKILLSHIKDIPQKDRAETIKNEMGVVLPNNISAEQWIRSKKHQYYLIAFIIFSVTIISIVAFAILGKGDINNKNPSVDSVITNTSLSLNNNLSEKGKKYVFDVILRNPKRSAISITKALITFNPNASKGNMFRNVLEVKGTYVIRVNKKGATTQLSNEKFHAYAWFPNGPSGKLCVKTPLTQSVKPKSVERFRIIVKFSTNSSFPVANQLKEAQFSFVWNGKENMNSGIIKL